MTTDIRTSRSRRHIRFRRTACAALSAATALALLSTTPMMPEAVGASTTYASTVFDNRFRVSDRSGELRFDTLSFVATEAESFGSGGGSLGEISFQIRSASNDVIDLRAGDTLAVTLTLPHGVMPVIQEGSAESVTTRGWSETWTTEPTEYGTTATQRFVVGADVRDELPRSVLPVLVQLDRSEIVDAVSIGAAFSQLPAGFTADAGQRVEAPVRWAVQAGVYNLAAGADWGAGWTADWVAGFVPGDTGVVSFSGHVADSAEALYVMAGDVFSTDVTLPRGYAPAALPPAAAHADGSTTSWKSSQNDNGEWIVTWSRSFDAAVREVHFDTVSFSIVAGPDAGDHPSDVFGAVTTLPTRFVTEHGENASSIPESVRFVRVGGNAYTSIALSDDGSVYLWGRTLAGSPASTPVVRPKKLDVPGDVRIVDFAMGSLHLLVLAEDGSVFVGGSNSSGQLGEVGSTSSRANLVRMEVPDGVRFDRVFATGYVSFALSSEGEVFSWGSGLHGLLGTGTISSRSRPEVVELPSTFVPVRLVTSEYSVFALGASGGAYVWGDASRNLTGLETDSNLLMPTPFSLPSGLPIVDAVGGSSVMLAVDSSGALFGWGRDEVILGDTSVVRTPKRLQIAGDQPVQAVGLADSFGGATGFLVIDGRWHAWGANSYGLSQTGVLGRLDRLHPVVGASEWSQLTSIGRDINPSTHYRSHLTSQSGAVYSAGWEFGWGLLGQGTVSDVAAEQAVRLHAPNR